MTLLELKIPGRAQFLCEEITMMTRRSTGIAWAVAAALLLLAPTANSMGGGGSEAV